MKCKTCPDFDLCERCYPERLDQARAAVAAAAGRAGGRHPASHMFGARRAGVVMTREAADVELLAMQKDKAEAEAKAEKTATTCRPKSADVDAERDILCE